VPLHNQQGNSLANFISGALGANGSVTRLLPLYAGRVNITFGSTISKAMTLQLSNQDPALSAAGIYLLLAAGANNLTAQASLSLPRSACTFTLTDTSGTAGNIVQAMVVIDEYQP
jgi:hypothetical protein